MKVINIVLMGTVALLFACSKNSADKSTPGKPPAGPTTVSGAGPVAPHRPVHTVAHPPVVIPESPLSQTSLADAVAGDLVSTTCVPEQTTLVDGRVYDVYLSYKNILSVESTNMKIYRRLYKESRSCLDSDQQVDTKAFVQYDYTVRANGSIFAIGASGRPWQITYTKFSRYADQNTLEVSYDYADGPDEVSLDQEQLDGGISQTISFKTGGNIYKR